MNKYSYKLNSDDIFDPELPLIKTKPVDGTIILWKSGLSPYIETHTAPTSASLPILFHPPESCPSIHFCIYLPTAGEEKSFLHEVSTLMTSLDNLCSKYPGAPFYLRGDFMSIAEILREGIFSRASLTLIRCLK